jgi:enoyl-CoA hydratase/carnithine racemase
VNVRTEPSAAGVLVVTIDRPQRRNAFDTATAARLGEVFAGVGPEVRALVLRGAGGVFCAGADLKERLGMSDDHWQAQHRGFEETFARLRAVEAPTVAAVEGVALGGGFEFALSCDVVVAGRSARFAFPEVTRGIIPGCGGTQLLARRAGPSRAKELVCSGRALDGEEAAGWGVVNLLVEDGAASARALELAETLAANAPIAVRQAKWAIDTGLALPLEEAARVELEAYARVVPTEDRREGVAAFNERRAPRFTGR